MLHKEGNMGRRYGYTLKKKPAQTQKVKSALTKNYVCFFLENAETIRPGADGLKRV
jgi:hypothetical protein